ncbi:hypothetical protein Patl1_25400 [Pistacia atlantica]|uniref:Uncharacterized protein n=1 Tax=Pistacia atlantica TaxID=434234 RepID=A0ACC1AZX0_9ROSI|nr:hypothetical protein Patl1_25400 [Pistacia atlantica]
MLPLVTTMQQVWHHDKKGLTGNTDAERPLLNGLLAQNHTLS